MNTIEGTRIERGVLIADNDELFLVGGAHDVVAFATGKRQPDPASIENLRINIAFRQERARDCGVAFMHLVAPEKFRVEPDGFPIKAPRSLADYYLESGCQFTYPVEELRSDETGRSYYRTDTHWAPHGLVRIAGLIGRAGGIDEDSVARTCAKMVEDLKPAPRRFVGDLGAKMQPLRSEPHLILMPSSPTGVFENGLAHVLNSSVNDGRLIVTFSNHETAADKFLLIFGDSYLHHCLPYLAYLFKRVVFCRTRFWHEEVVAAVQPDMVVTQMAERYLSFVNPDAIAPPFQMIPYLLGRPLNISPEAAIAISRAFSGRRTPNLSLFQATK